MCGILGIYIIKDSSIFNHDKFESALLKMEHRGPDAHLVNHVSENLILGHVRLSIIDLSPESNQPLNINEDYWIVFNGEIYNYIEIRKELKALGYIFKTESDTEVLLNSYIEWGEKCVSNFNGDWAFAIYNKLTNTLFCSRDRFGVKPFNYAIINNNFIFSSEIKSILHYFPELKEPNYNIISNFCRNSLGAQIEQTWFRNIKRLLPAHNLIIKNESIKIEKYWDYPKKINHNIIFPDAVEKYKELFIEACRLRLRSDVPVGATLSSGLDSTSIVSVLKLLKIKNHKTFTAYFDDTDFYNSEFKAYKEIKTVNEKLLVNKLADDFNFDTNFIKSDNNDFIIELKKVIYHMESGHSSNAIIPLSKVHKYARDYVSVVLEGQGADELLSGYIINTFPTLIYELLKSGKIKQAFKEFNTFRTIYSIGYSFKQFIRLLDYDWLEKLYHLKSGYNKVFGEKLKNYNRIKDYPSNPVGYEEGFSRALFKSHSGGLGNLLHYGDALSMAYSIESRLPFMDVNLVEFAFTLPYNFKMRNGMGKYIHRKAMEKIVPSYILDNRTKFGFNTPLALHFNSKESPANLILLSDRCLKRGLFDRDGLTELIDKQILGLADNSTRLFRLLSVELWFRNFTDN